MNTARYRTAAISGWCVAGVLTVAVGGASLGLWTIPVVVAQGDPISPELKSKWLKVEQLLREVMKVEDGAGSQNSLLKRTLDLRSSHLRRALEKGRMPKAEQEALSVALDAALEEGQRIVDERAQREAERQRVRSARPVYRKSASERAAEVKARFKTLFSKDKATRDRAQQELFDRMAADGAPQPPSSSSSTDSGPK